MAEHQDKLDAQSDMATCLYSSVLFVVFLCFLSSFLLPMPQPILPNVHGYSISCLNITQSISGFPHYVGDL
jgi:hypothetical protein